MVWRAFGWEWVLRLDFGLGNSESGNFRGLIVQLNTGNVNEEEILVFSNFLNRNQALFRSFLPPTLSGNDVLP